MTKKLTVFKWEPQAEQFGLDCNKIMDPGGQKVDSYSTLGSSLIFSGSPGHSGPALGKMPDGLKKFELLEEDW